MYDYNCTGVLGGGTPERRNVPDRYKAKPEKTQKGVLVYVVEDTSTGEWKHVYDCFLWAEKKAKELNEKWRKCNRRYCGKNQ